MKWWTGRSLRVHSAAAKAAGSGLQVWEVNPLVKVFPDTPPQAQARAVSVELARNEYQAFQLALRIGAGDTTRVSIAVSPLKGPGGVRVAAGEGRARGICAGGLP